MELLCDRFLVQCNTDDSSVINDRQTLQTLPSSSKHSTESKTTDLLNHPRTRDYLRLNLQQNGIVDAVHVSNDTMNKTYKDIDR